MKKKITSFMLIAVLVFTFSGLPTYAMTSEEKAADREYSEWLENVKIKSAGSEHYGSAGSGSSSASSTSSSETISISEYAKESAALTNKYRVASSVHELLIDDELMVLAAIRAKELAEKYSHERPDGTRVSQEYFCGEIINRRASTPAIAVDSWMASTKGHRELILREKYQSMGSGCYQADDGTIYWVQIFSK